LRRSKFLTDDDRREIKAAYKVFYRNELDFKDALARVKTEFHGPAVKHWVEFLEAPSKRGFCRFRAGGRRGVPTSDND
jgi:acyl-[acyl carrier protein]--UDP-N-acetylglucosamine O-acyltransferase